MNPHTETFNAMSIDPLWLEFTEEDLRKVERYMIQWDLKQGDSILEPGCGTGRLTGKLVEKLGPTVSVIACDSSPEMIAEAANRKLPDFVRLVQSATLDLNCGPHSFDSIICFNVLPHLVPIIEHLNAFHDWLKPSGVLWICHTASRDFINNIHAESGMQDHLLPDQKELQDMLHCANFKVLDFEDNDQLYWCKACLSG